MDRAILRTLEDYERRFDPYLARAVLFGMVAILCSLGIALAILIGAGVWALFH